MKKIVKEYELEDINKIEDFYLYDKQSIKELISTSVFLDLEHYIYKEPKCIGIFGAGLIEGNKFISTQFLLEGKGDKEIITKESVDYLKRVSKGGKKNIITFAGANDFSVLNFMIKKYRIYYEISKYYTHIDLQNRFMREFGVGIGLKELEGLLNIERSNIVPSGSQIAKTFSHLIKDEDYINRIPQSKLENYLNYNRMDILNLYKILIKWKEISPEINEYKIRKEEKRAKKLIEKMENQSKLENIEN